MRNKFAHTSINICATSIQTVQCSDVRAFRRKQTKWFLYQHVYCITTKITSNGKVQELKKNLEENRDENKKEYDNRFEDYRHIKKRKKY